VKERRASIALRFELGLPSAGGVRRWPRQEVAQQPTRYTKPTRAEGGIEDGNNDNNNNNSNSKHFSCAPVGILATTTTT
jgi:hypothetical protein